MDFLSRLSLGEKLVGAGGILLAIATFLPWYKYSASGFGFTSSTSWSLWDSSGILAFLVLAGSVVAVGIILLRLFDVFDISEQGVPEALVVLIGAAAAALITVLKFLSVPGGGAEFETLGASASSGRSWGAWLALVFAIIMVAGAVIKFQEER